MKEYDFCPANPLTRTQEEFVIYAMKEACRQTLELAAENAELQDKGCWNGICWESTVVIDKQSILDTIKQIE